MSNDETDQVIIPTRVIPATDHTPNPGGAPGLPPAPDRSTPEQDTPGRTRRLRNWRYAPGPSDWTDGPDETHDLPPRRRTPPPASGPPATAPGGTEAPQSTPPPVLHVQTCISDQDADAIGQAVARAMTPPAPQTSRWQQAADTLLRWLITWRTLWVLLVALVPIIPPQYYSLVTGWGALLSSMRADQGAGAAAVSAGGVILITTLLSCGPHVIRRWWAPPLMVAAILGATGALRWWDVVEIMTGVPL